MRQLKLGDNGPEVIELQKLLNARLASTQRLRESGAFLSDTRDAVVHIQRKLGLWPDGVVGSRTWAKLQPPAETPVDMPSWMAIAQREVGVIEFKGQKHNPRIVEYLRSTTNADLGDAYRAKDETAWCAAFVNWCLLKAGLPAKRDALARRWIDYGYAVEEDDAPYGAITIIRSAKKNDLATGSTTGYHIGFLHDLNKSRVTLLGGNQSDSVKLSAFNRNAYMVVATRWPSSLATHKRGCTLTA